jgi:hypothetical protein
MAEGDHSLVGVEQLCTGCESQEALSSLLIRFRLARVRILWKGIDDPALGEIDHQVVTTSVEDVGEDLCPGLDNDSSPGCSSGIRRRGSPWVTRCAASE